MAKRWLSLLESGHLKESGVLKERGKVVKWSLETVTISAAEHLKQEREKEKERRLWKEKKSMNMESWLHGERFDRREVQR